MVTSETFFEAPGGMSADWPVGTLEVVLVALFFAECQMLYPLRTQSSRDEYHQLLLEPGTCKEDPTS